MSEPDMQEMSNMMSNYDSATSAFRTTVVNDINSLKFSVDELKEAIQTLKGQMSKEPNTVDDCDTCF